MADQKYTNWYARFADIKRQAEELKTIEKELWDEVKNEGDDVKVVKKVFGERFKEVDLEAINTSKTLEDLVRDAIY